MMISAASLTSTGLRDWLVQRVTAVVLAAYTLFLFIYFLSHPHLTYDQWHALFQCHAMQIFTVLALLSILGHAWVGIWTVLTDYIKCAYLRITLTVLMILALFSYLIWGVMIVWG